MGASLSGLLIEATPSQELSDCKYELLSTKSGKKCQKFSSFYVNMYVVLYYTYQHIRSFRHGILDQFQISGLVYL